MPDFPRGFPRRGEIYWAPHEGVVQDKTRPVLVVSNDVGNQHASTVVVVPLST